MNNPTHSHSFWRDRNPAGCLTCGKTESELLESFIRTQKEQSYKEGYEAGDAAGRENVGKWFMNSEIPTEIIKAKQEERERILAEIERRRPVKPYPKNGREVVYMDSFGITWTQEEIDEAGGLTEVIKLNNLARRGGGN